jgi:outer membrane receptor protein involved in Fe transport
VTTGRAFQIKVAADAEPRHPLFTNLSLYAQDSARVTERLTIVYGLRWELNPAPTERGGDHPAVFRGFSEGSDFPAGNLPVGIVALAPRGTPLWNTAWLNFAPRAGVAYQLSPERGTTLRGGLGLFYDLGTGQAAQAFGSVFTLRAREAALERPFPARFRDG